MTTFLRDLIHSLRLLRSRPGFTLVAVLSLSLGIAANTTIFSILSATLLTPVDLPNSERVVYLSTYANQSPQQVAWVSVPEYEVWQERAQSFELMGVMFGATQGRTLGADGDASPAEQLAAFAGQREVLDVWGVQPLLGRLFTPDEDRVGEPSSVALISHRFWQRRFDGDPDVLGRTLVLDGSPATIIGVMPEGLSETVRRPDVDLWVPWGPAPSMMISETGFTHVYALLRPGVSMAQAQTEMDAIAAQLALEMPRTHEDRGIRVQSMHDFYFGQLREPLVMLQGAVLLVLLIACANVAVLLLAAAASRQTEIALRGALGAGRGRIVRLVLTESLVLAVLGGLLGLALAWVGIRLFAGMAPPWFPGVERIGLDPQVLFFTAAIVVLTAIVFGLVPALASTKPNLSGLLNETPRGSTGGSARARFRLALVTGQTALALLLLIGAGLLITSFLRLQGNPLGGDPENVLTVRISYPQSEVITFIGEQYQGVGLWEVNPSVIATFERVRERLAAVPGVASVAGSTSRPFGGALGMSFRREGGNVSADAPPTTVAYLGVTHEYFDTMRIPIVRGRGFDDQDRAGAGPVAVISETMARLYWPDEDPIGLHLALDFVPGDPSREIVGVAADALLSRYQQQPGAMLYVPYAQQTPLWQGPSAQAMRGGKWFLVRTEGDPMSLVSSVRGAVAEIDANRPVGIDTLEDFLGAQIEETRLFAVLLGVFAAIAATLAAVGLYGVIAYTVAERGKEIGIRVALGAAAGNVTALVMRQAVAVIGLGLLLGLLGAVALTRLLAAALWGVEPTDPTVYAAVALLLVGVALLACLVPTRRALATDPAVTLRNPR